MLEQIGAIAEWFIPTAAAIAAVVKYYWNSRDDHAKMMLELVREFQRDYVEKFYGLVDRKEHHFYIKDLSFTSGAEERDADTLLLFMENILHLRAKGTISRDEFRHFEYYLNRIIGDLDFRRYLDDFESLCAKEGVTSPFVRILKYRNVRIQPTGADEAEAHSEDNSSYATPIVPDDSDNRTTASEEEFVSYLKRYYGDMTRTAKSVKSRVEHHMRSNGWSYANPMNENQLLDAIHVVGAEIKNTDVAASVRAALRQYYRASFNNEPNT